MGIHKSQPLLFICYFIFIIGVTVAHFSTTQTHNSTFMQKFIGSKIGDHVTGLEHIKQYLVRYGYMSSSHVGIEDSSPKFDHVLESAVKKYQTFFGLNISGELDWSTLSMMAAPRCGVPDLIDNELPNNLNKSFYAFGPRKWYYFKLTWTLDYGTRTDALTPINIALTSWEAGANVFEFVDNNSGEHDFNDLKFGFYRGAHGDKYPFDGQGGVVGHASYPTRGKIHFDGDELWSGQRVDKYAMDITSVALHEIGHALGLAHSTLKSSVMWPSIGPGQIKELSPDDISGLKAMYGFE